MRQAYHVQLADLGDHGSRMARLAGDTMRDASRALLEADLALAEQVITRDVVLDDMRATTEDVALELLALQSPVASDLRSVVSALWIVADLQRMGTLAIHVAKAARRRHPAAVLPDGIRPVFERMGRCRRASRGPHRGDAAQRDIELARQLEGEDSLMDDLHSELFTALLGAGLGVRSAGGGGHLVARPVLRAVR